MKNTILSALLIGACSLLGTVATAQTKSDEAALRAMLKEAYDAFTAKDATRFAAIFTEDATFIPPPGYYMKGKSAIEAAHVELFKMPMTINKTEILTSDIRFLSPNVAVLTWAEYQESEINGQAQKGQTQGSATVVRQNGKWLTAACQMTPVMPATAGN